MDKKVTAVVVTYNRKTLLKECIESLLAQTYKNLDILVIDNASTDGTEGFVKKSIIHVSHMLIPEKILAVLVVFNLE